MTLAFFLSYVLMLTVVRVLLGLILVVFAVAKLFPVEAFEFLLVDRKIIGWDGTPFLARFIIFWEILLGLAIIFNYKLKKVMLLTVVTLLFFTTYLIYDLIFFGNRVDCGCTGQLFSLSTNDSIIKNIFLLALTSLLFKKGKQYNWRRPRLLLLFLVGASVGVTLGFAPFYSGYQLSEKVNEKINLDMLPNEEISGFPINYKNDEIIVCFVSPKCEHCKRAIERLKIINDQNELPPIYLIFYGKTATVNTFITEFNVDFPYVIFPDKEFMRIVKGEIPTMYHIDNGILKQVWKGDMFEANELINLYATKK